MPAPWKGKIVNSAELFPRFRTHHYTSVCSDGCFVLFCLSRLKKKSSPGLSSRHSWLGTKPGCPSLEVGSGLGRDWGPARSSAQTVRPRCQVRCALHWAGEDPAQLLMLRCQLWHRVTIATEAAAREPWGRNPAWKDRKVTLASSCPNTG